MSVRSAEGVTSKVGGGVRTVAIEVRDVAFVRFPPLLAHKTHDQPFVAL